MGAAAAPADTADADADAVAEVTAEVVEPAADADVDDEAKAAVVLPAADAEDEEEDADAADAAALVVLVEPTATSLPKLTIAPSTLLNNAIYSLLILFGRALTQLGVDMRGGWLR